jgi:hypothetical protein
MYIKRSLRRAGVDCVGEVVSVGTRDCVDEVRGSAVVGHGSFVRLEYGGGASGYGDIEI